MAENYFTKKMDKGSLNISEEVIASIIRSAVLEVEGVSDLANAAGADIAEFIGLKPASRGIKISFEEEDVSADIIITVNYGSNIVEVAKKVQDNVFASVSGLTGIDNAIINIHVAGIAF